MTEQDRGAFAELMLGIGETYGEPVSEARMEIYFRALADLPLAALQQAASVHVNNSRFFPKPVELREAIEGRVEDRAEMAWAQVCEQVRRVGWTGTPNWPDEATERAVRQVFGSWGRLCETLPASGPELLGYAKLFKAQFGACARQEAAGLLPPSATEAKAALGSLVSELARRGLPAPGLEP